MAAAACGEEEGSGTVGGVVGHYEVGFGAGGLRFVRFLSFFLSFSVIVAIGKSVRERETYVSVYQHTRVWTNGRSANAGSISRSAALHACSPSAGIGTPGSARLTSTTLSSFVPLLLP